MINNKRLEKLTNVALPTTQTQRLVACSSSPVCHSTASITKLPERTKTLSAGGVCGGMSVEKGFVRAIDYSFVGSNVIRFKQTNIDMEALKRLSLYFW